jgi:hypothetical protein
VLRHEHTSILESTNHRLGTCAESFLASPWDIISFARKTSSLVNRTDRLNAMLFAYNKIIIAVGRRRVHHTGPAICGYVRGRKHRATATDRCQWMHTLPSDHVCASQRAPDFQRLAESLFQRNYTSSCYNIPLATARLNLYHKRAAASVSFCATIQPVDCSLGHRADQTTGRQRGLTTLYSKSG